MVMKVREDYYTGTNAQRVAYTGSLHVGVKWLESDTGDVYKYSGSSWIQSEGSGAHLTADVGLISSRSNRHRTGITATWPGDDTFSVTFTQSENIRRYRILALGGSAGDYVKWCEDAANEAQAESLLGTPANSGTAAVSQQRVYAVPASTVVTQQHWSEWQELSKDSNDSSLSRLDFLGSAAGAFTILVEAE